MATEAAEQSMKEQKGKDGKASDKLPQQVHRISANTPGPGADDKAALSATAAGIRDTVPRVQACGVSLLWQKGHMRQACWGKRKTAPSKTSDLKFRKVCHVNDEGEQDLEDSPFHHVSSCGVTHSPPIQIKVKFDECLVVMEVDTGASMSLISETTFRGLWSGRVLPPLSHTYSWPFSCRKRTCAL